MNDRHYSPVDHIIMQVQGGLKTLFSDVIPSRPSPAKNLKEPRLTIEEKKQSAGYMRVNHTGEVCAQALYHGQLVTARNENTRRLLKHAASEETDHLAWCHERLKQLNSHRSYLNIFWYSHSFFIGVLAGAAGDSWSLGFVEETEKQVQAHLEDHLNKLPKNDTKSRQIVTQMKADEIEHGESANRAGGKPLPNPIKKLMTLSAKVMTTTTYWF